MIIGVVGDGADAVGLLDAADTVLEALRARDCPRAGEGFGISKVRPELLGAVGSRVVWSGCEIGLEPRQRRNIRNEPWL